MSGKSAQPSQIQLFAEQISEQINRLRVLSGTDPKRADTVAIKRAVMATRLLAGGARALELPTLPRFLDELLHWLQDIQRLRQPASPTQTLILDAVVQFEEELIRELEHEEEGAEISAFEEEIDELRALIRRNEVGLHTADRAREEREEKEQAARSRPIQPQSAEDLGKAADAPTARRPAASSVPPGPTPVADSEPQEPALSQAEFRFEEQVLTPLKLLSDRLHGLEAKEAQTLLGQPGARTQLERLRVACQSLLETGSAPISPLRSSESSGALPPLRRRVRASSRDPLVKALLESLRQRQNALQGRLEFDVVGSVDALPTEVQDAIQRVLENLMQDSCDVLQQMLQEDDAPPQGWLELQLNAESDRLRISLRDNGPQLAAGPRLEQVDPLGLYRGLRRSRGLIDELHGIILVEPHDQQGTRFVLSLPKDPQHPVVRVMDLGTASAALPGLLIDDYVRTDGLLFHRDTDGEHFVRNGHPVPLVDLAQYVPGLRPIAEEATGIVIVGSVEKRLGIYCNGLGESIELTSFEGAVSGWDDVSARSVDLGGARLPLLSVAQLLRLRMQMPSIEEAGSVHDTALDMYIERPSELEAAPEGLAPSGQRVLLVNHSEFRRREIAHTLEHRGYQVTAVQDIPGALRALQHEPVDLIVSDLRLGREETASFEDLRRACPSVPVILSSSVRSQEAERLARRTKADACWLEPYRGGELDAILRKLG